MDFDDDFECCENIYQFFFLHGKVQGSSLILCGKIKDQNNYNSCEILLRPVSKCIFVKTKEHFHSFPEEIFKNHVETDLKDIIKDLHTYSSEVVCRKTIFSSKVEPVLKIQYLLPEELNFDNSNISKDSCIEYIYGLKDNSLHTFFLEKGIKGPCWLQVQIYTDGTKSFQLSKIRCHPRCITVIPKTSLEDTKIPPLKVLFADIVSMPLQGEVTLPMALAVSVGIFDGKTISHLSTKLLKPPSPGCQTPNINKEMDVFTGIIQKFAVACKDVDIIICYNQQIFTDCTNACRGYFLQLFEPCVIMDLRLIASELYPDIITENELFQKLKLGASSTSSRNTNQFLHQRIKKLLMIANQIDLLPTYLLISQVTGSPLNEVCSWGQLKRVDCMLKHKITQSQASIRAPILIPEKQINPTKASISGGKIIEPRTGIYDEFVVSFDFKSLYPSVIREFNLSFDGDQNLLPNLMEELSNLREALASQEQELEMPKNCVTRSAIIKKLSNSIYGCLSSVYSSFYCPVLANKITEHGRELLTSLEKSASLIGRVLAGQTDSIFLELYGACKYDQAWQISKKFQDDINTTYRFIKLKLEGIFSRAFIIGKQQYILRYHKSYPRNNDTDVWIIKGLFRKTTPRICRKILLNVLSTTLTNQRRAVKTDTILRRMSERFSSNAINDYVMHVQLQNPPDTYKAQTPYGNILQRKRMESYHRYKQYDHVSYVICLDGTTNGVNSRAYDLEEIQLNGYGIDKDYYRQKQMLPLIEKILDLVPECFNIDYILNFIKPRAQHLQDISLKISDYLPQHYKRDSIFPLHFRCLKCWRLVIFGKDWHPQLLVTCPLCEESLQGEGKLLAAHVQEVRSSVEDIINGYWFKLNSIEPLLQIKRTQLKSKAEIAFACRKILLFKQLSLFREVIDRLLFCLYSSCSKMNEDLKIELKELLNGLNLLLDENFTLLQAYSKDDRLDVFDFKRFRLD